ncbi:MAG: hypothetical protein IIW48_00210 [Clostridia bacterium]|nr:hypothetical protein [Clostridia bacterium]
MAEIITALVTLIGSLGGTFGGIIVSSKLTNYRIEQLEKKVEKHNQLIDRVYKLERADEVEEEKIKVINHRIDDLEQYHK